MLWGHGRNFSAEACGKQFSFFFLRKFAEVRFTSIRVFTYPNFSGNHNGGTVPCKCDLRPTKVTRGSGKTYLKAQSIYRDWKLLSGVLLRVKHLTIFSWDCSLTVSLLGSKTLSSYIRAVVKGFRYEELLSFVPRDFMYQRGISAPYAWIHGHE